MAIRNTETEFGSVARFFHWTIALLVVFMICLGFILHDTSGDLKSIFYTLHKSCGLTILGLLVLGYLWRLTSIIPKFPAGTSVVQAKTAKWTHLSLYLLLFLQTLSGWTMATASGYPPNFWWIVKIPAPWANVNKSVANVTSFIHHYCVWVLVGVICLHILGALYHWWIKRDGVFQRMQPNFTKKKRFYDKD